MMKMNSAGCVAGMRMSSMPVVVTLIVVMTVASLRAVVMIMAKGVRVGLRRS